MTHSACLDEKTQDSAARPGPRPPADLLDCVERFLRLNGPHPKKRFGGLQMIFIGDLYQLPPVVTSAERDVFSTNYETPYFFSSHTFNDPAFDMEFVELEKIYRPKKSDAPG
ncbi:MAG: hypothetical protein JXE07_05105 [Candidatus Aminicenantes bacterium]|nr:hypothetical protein [Candidatus Aminicenantes bacterium]